MQIQSKKLGLTGISSELIGVYGFEQMNQVIIAYYVKSTGDIALTRHHEKLFTSLAFLVN